MSTNCYDFYLKEELDGGSLFLHSKRTKQADIQCTPIMTFIRGPQRASKALTKPPHNNLVR